MNVTVKCGEMSVGMQLPDSGLVSMEINDEVGVMKTFYVRLEDRAITSIMQVTRADVILTEELPG